MLMLCAPVATFAQKFGHLDSQALISSLPEAIKIQGELEAQGKIYENDLKAMQDELQRKAEEYDKTKSTMNATKQQETETNINQMIQKYQQAMQDNQQAFQKAQAEKMQPIQEKIMKAIENVAKAGGYVYIMEKGVGQPIYISDTLSKDVTADVKAELNKLK
jgi:outer membrane protein